MLAFQWNALRAGDRVMMHDDLDRDLTLREGVVELVQPRHRGENDIGIRIDHHERIVRPRRHAVHLSPIDRRSSCWRCDTIAARPAGETRGGVAG